MQTPPWAKAAAEQGVQAQPSAVSPQAPLSTSPIVTPAVGPPGQTPPQPLVPQNALVGLGTTVATNMLSTGLTGDPDLFKLAAGCNVVAQIVKHHPRFNEKLWTLPLMVAVGVFLACWFYRDPTHWDLLHFWMPGYFELPGKGVLDGITAAFQAGANYSGLQATGVSPMKPVGFENSVEGQAIAKTTLAVG